MLSQNLGRRVAELLTGTVVYLVGMMGTGKSAVGKRLGAALGYRFVDTDAIIEELACQSIAEIFKREGEGAFRDREAHVLEQVVALRNTVVSTGGGAVLRPSNWNLLRAGVVVWLNGAPELLARRVVRDDVNKRPLLSSTKDSDADSTFEAAVEKIRELTAQRQAFYSQADITVDLACTQGDPNGAGIDQVAARVLESLQERLEADRSLVLRGMEDWAKEHLQRVDEVKLWAHEE